MNKVYIIIGVLILLIGSFIFYNKPRDTLEEIHMKTLSGFTYKTDWDLYGVADKWVVNCNEGDCEDYALCMYKEVGGELIIVRTQDGVAHMVLDVEGVIVDNLSWHTYNLEDMKYIIVARIPKGNVVYSKY